MNPANKKSHGLTVVCDCWFFGGCTLLQPPPAEDPVLIKLTELERRLQNIERVVQNQSLVESDSTGQFAAERRGDEMQGRVEELEYRSENDFGDRQRQLYVGS